MLGFLVGLLIGAAVLGIIIAVMEKGEFPGWGKMILCVLAAIIPAFVINLLLPPSLFFVGLIIGAICAGIAASIYLAIQVALSLAFQQLLR